MAREHIDQPYSLPVAGDLSANGKSFVSINGSGQLAATAAGAMPDGILDNPADCTAANKLGRFNWLPGVYKVKAGTGGVAIGANVHVGANGSVVTSATTLHKIVGKCLVAAAVGEYAEIFYNPWAYGANP